MPQPPTPPNHEQHWFAVTSLTFAGFFACVSSDILSAAFPLSYRDVVQSVERGESTPPHVDKRGPLVLLAVTAGYILGIVVVYVQSSSVSSMCFCSGLPSLAFQ